MLSSQIHLCIHPLHQTCCFPPFFSWFAGTIWILKRKNLDTVLQMWSHQERFPLTWCFHIDLPTSWWSGCPVTGQCYRKQLLWLFSMIYGLCQRSFFCRQAGESLICFWTMSWPPMVLASLLKQLACPTQPQCHQGRADRAVITRSTLRGYTHFIVSHSKKCGKLP